MLRRLILRIVGFLLLFRAAMLVLNFALEPRVHHRASWHGLLAGSQATTFMLLLVGGLAAFSIANGMRSQKVL